MSKAIRNPFHSSYVRGHVKRTLAAFLFMLVPLTAQVRSERYALILEEPPVADIITSPKDLRNQAATDRKNRILANQSELRQALSERKVRITGATQTLLNAVYV